MPALFASLLVITAGIACPPPSRCPYCCASLDAASFVGHRIRWGFYWRYAERRNRRTERIRVQRYRCRFVRRTFSLLPDGFLPYHSFRLGDLLRWLYRMLVDGRGAAALAAEELRHRTTLADLKRKFERAAQILRLPGHPGALAPPGILKGLARMTSRALISLFRNWKELEPKHSVVGIYAR